MRHTLIPTINFGRDQIPPIAIISNLSEKHKLKSMHFIFSSNKKSFILKLLFETIKMRFLAESRAFNVNCYAREKFEDKQILDRE